MNPTVISDRYELGERIGLGGMAEVYLAHDRVLGRSVAIKILNRSYAANPAFAERFKHEAQAAARLDHPNVVPVYDWGPFDDTYFIAMGYVPGLNLKELLARDGPLPEATVLRIAGQVASALAEAHHHGVVHRDVKPHNILLDQRGHTKVSDFGIARAAGMARLTESHAVVGTADYLSPEQAQREDVDGRSDIYSLGVVMYELLTGRTPFSGDSMVSVALSHVHERPKPPRQFRPDISPATEAIVLKAMAKLPSQRFRSASEMRTAIDRAYKRLVSPDRAVASPAVAVPARRQATESMTSYRSRLTRRGETARSPRDQDRRGWVWSMAAVVAMFLVAIALLLARAMDGRDGGTGREFDGSSIAGSIFVGTASPTPAQAVSETPVPTGPASDTPTAIPTEGPTPAPTATPAPAQPAPTPTPEPPPPTATLPPAPTPVPPTATSEPRSQPAGVDTETSGPVEAVNAFYRRIERRDYEGAAALWTERMRQQYPPPEFINGRFASTRQIVLNRNEVVGLDQSTGSAAVAVDITEVTASETRRWVGTWHLVRTQSGWLLDAPDLRPG